MSRPRSQNKRPRKPRATPPPPSTREPPEKPALLDRAAERFPMLERIPAVSRRRAARYSRQDVLASVPFRHPAIEWELRAPEGNNDGPEEVVLKVPRRQDRLGRILNRLFEAPPHRLVVLDELGTDVWRMCDGETSVEALITALAQKHRLERREVEVSLTTYLRTLAKRGFIGLRAAPPVEETKARNRRK